MCYLISVSAGGPDASLSDHFRAYGLFAAPTKNPSVLHALGGGSYDVTDGHCSCSFYRTPAASDRVAADLEAVRDRYEKKGWSKAKIDRALKAKSSSRARSARDPAFDFPGAVDALLHSGSVVQLLCHSYSGRFDDETFDVTANVTLAPERFRLERGAFPIDAVVTLGDI